MIKLSSNLLNFGSISKNEIVIKTVTVYNNGLTTIEILDIFSSSSDYEIAPLAFTIEPNSSKTFSIKYTANTSLSSIGTILVINDSYSDEIINVLANVVLPTISIDTTPINFNSVATNDVVTVTRRIENTSSNESILSIKLANTNSNFSLSKTIFNINSGSYEDFNISFNPVSIGLKNDVVLVESNIGTYHINVSGLSILPSYSLSQSYFNFLTNPINNKKNIILTISNISNVNLIIHSFLFDKVEFSVNTSAITILPLQSYTFIISFLPLTTEHLLSNAIINTNAGNILLSCEGTGIAEPFLVTESQIDFEIFSINELKTVSTIVNNIGVIDAVINNIVFPVISGITFSSQLNFPYVLQKNSSLNLDINILSLVETTFNNSISIQSNANNSPNSINIIGTSQSPEIVVDVTKLDFGTIQLGEQKKISFVIANSKSVDLIVHLNNTINFTFSEIDFTIKGNSSKTIDAFIFVDEIISTDTSYEINESLIISSNDVNNNEITVQLVANVNLLSLTVIPDNLNNNFLTKDIVYNTIVSIINKSFFNIYIDNFETINFSTGMTYSVTFTDLPISLTPGSSIDVNLSFLCSDIGKISGYLKFNSRIGASQNAVYTTVQYNGIVNSPTILLSTTNIDFLNVAIGQSKFNELIVSNNSSEADLSVLLTVDSPFYFKGSYEQSILVTFDSLAILSRTFVVFESISVVDSLTGQEYVVGNPINQYEFSINTEKGFLTFNDSVKNKVLKASYDYKVQSLDLKINKNSKSIVDVGFLPNQIGIQTSQIIVSSNDVVNPIKTINLSGNGIANVTSIALNSQIIKFVAKVNTVVSQKIKLKNTGTVILFANNISINLPFSVTIDKFSIDPNETFDILIYFSPIDLIEVSQNIIIHSNATDLLIPVVGQGKSPQIVLPSSFDFGNIALNSKSEKDLVISNSSDVDLNVELKMSSSFFTIIPTTMTVLPNSSYTVKVIFDPTEVKLYSEYVKILSDDKINGNIDFNILGNGVNKPVIKVESRLEFEKTNVKEASQKVLEVFNIGSATLVITDISVTENLAIFSLISSSSVSVAAGSSTQITVSFSPKSVVNDYITGKLLIKCNDENNSQVEVLLKGTSFRKDGEWISFNLQDMMPDSLISVANGVSNVISPLKTVLGLIKQVMNIVKVFLVDSTSALKVILQQIFNLIEKYVNDLSASGIYLLPVFPSTNYYDVNNNSSSFSKMLASVGGGSEVFKQKVISAFDDIYDTKRPQFSESAVCAAFVIAVDSGNIATIVKGIMDLKKIFTSIDWQPDVPEPQSVQATSGESIVVHWELPEIIEFNIAGIFTQQKFVDLITGFQVYRSETQSRLVTASEDYRNENNELVYRKSDVVDIVTHEKQKFEVVNASDYFSSFKDFAVGFRFKNSNVPIKNIGYLFKDDSVETGKSYFYTVRTCMGDIYSQLSNEVVATKTVAVTSKKDEFLNRCVNFKCSRVKEKTKLNKVLSSVKVKLIETTGLKIQSRSLFVSDKIIPDAGRQQVNNFTLTINSVKLDYNNLVIRNVSETNRRISDDKLKIDTKLFYNNNHIKIWDDDSNDAKGKSEYFEILNKTKLVPGWDLLVVNDNNSTIITISDISNIGYKAGDIVVVEYYLNDYTAACSKSKKYFNSIACNNGSIKSLCPSYSNAKCIYHGGSGCLNSGNTKVGDRCIPNTIFFDAFRCQDSSSGGFVSLVNRSKTNDPSYCIETTGVCAGYRSVNEDTVGLYPNWSNINIQGLIKPIENFIEVLKKWVDRELAATQEGSETTQQFIDLLTKKIEELERIIDTIQNVIDTITSIFSSDVGFHILMIEPASGGSQRIKQIIQSAEGGPNSDQNGYTSGLVMLLGGPDLKTAFQFLKMFFKK